MAQHLSLNQERAADFLKNNNIINYKLTKIAGDCSYRSYYRIADKNRSYILMYAPPQYENIVPFITVGKFLNENNLAAPKIFFYDQKNGFILLEDFGDLTYNKFLLNFYQEKRKKAELEVYKKACDVLIKISDIQLTHLLNYKTLTHKLMPYNHELLYKEVLLFVDWYLPLMKKEFSLSEKYSFKRLFFELFDHLGRNQPVLVLRDYHADNLMVLNSEIGKNKENFTDIRVGLLDFQDALIGPAAYDLVSLLEDTRRDIDEENEKYLFNYYLNRRKENFTNKIIEIKNNKQNFSNNLVENIIKSLQFDEEQFIDDYNIFSLQRNIKIFGIFARQALKYKRINYLPLIPKKYVLRRLSDNNLAKIKNKNLLNLMLQLKDLLFKYI